MCGIEYLFLNIRGKSVGEELEVNIICPDDGESTVPVMINLDLDNPNEDVYWYEGNNALPLADGRCCDTCNGIVIADRITNIRMKGV